MSHLVGCLGQPSHLFVKINSVPAEPKTTSKCDKSRVHHLSTGTGCPGRLWSLLLWRYSRPAWTRSSAACCRWPCFGRRVGLDDPQRALPTPNILWSLIHLDGQPRSWTRGTKRHKKAALLLSTHWSQGGERDLEHDTELRVAAWYKTGTLPANICAEQERSKERTVHQKGISDQICFLG